jgi:hypothetical protein
MIDRNKEKAKAIDMVLWGRKGLKSEQEPFSIPKLMDFLRSRKSKPSGEKQQHEICRKILEDL